MMCVHHWLCDSPSNKGVPARCTLCGEVKNFPSEPKGFRPNAYEAKRAKLARARERRANGARTVMDTRAAEIGV